MRGSKMPKTNSKVGPLLPSASLGDASTSVVKTKILIAEDEAHLLYFMRLNLEELGFDVIGATNGQMALNEFHHHTDIAAAIIDVNMPKLDGFEVVRAIREKDDRIGIIILSAQASDKDRLLGLSYGADDYMAKPFRLEELVLKTRRLIKRVEQVNAVSSDLVSSAHIETEETIHQIVSFDGLELDLDREYLTTPKGEFKLTHIEASLLAEFMKNPSSVISREQLLHSVWSYGKGVESRTVDNFIVRLRKYLEEKPSKPQRLLSVRGRGYKLVPQKNSKRRFHFSSLKK